MRLLNMSLLYHTSLSWTSSFFEKLQTLCQKLYFSHVSKEWANDNVNKTEKCFWHFAQYHTPLAPQAVQRNNRGCGERPAARRSCRQFPARYGSASGAETRFPAGERWKRPGPRCREGVRAGHRRHHARPLHSPRYQLLRQVCRQP